jgi:CxxC motif-containing protein (DUF1111 family)
MREPTKSSEMAFTFLLNKFKSVFMVWVAALIDYLPVGTPSFSINRKIWLLSSVTLALWPSLVAGQSVVYPHNGVTCERCHSVPAGFGTSSMIVERVGASIGGKFAPATEGGIHHRNGESAQNSVSAKQITGERVSLSLLGDGYVEAINNHDVERNVEEQRGANLGVRGVIVRAPVLEGAKPTAKMQVGRFGWKSQHSSLMSSCADSLRNELGMRNRLYPDEYPTHAPGDSPTPFDAPDAKTHKTELERLVDEIRHTSPPARDANIAATPDARSGENLFIQVGCAVCHVPTYKTLPPGTPINGGTYKVPKFIGNKVIHPYSDFLLHDVGTGDGIPQAAKPEYLDQSTANKFRTPPLWGLRFRAANLMHDGDTPSTEAAIKRHAGEATTVRQNYDHLTPAEKRQILVFLNSL